MKFRRKISSLLLFTAPLAGFASAQTNNISTIQHVIVVIQENRTPDNLFHEDSVLVNHGADIIPAAVTLATACKGQAATLQPAALASCFDPDHSHGQAPNTNYLGAWTLTYDSGKMDGACNVHVNVTQDCSKPYPSCYNSQTKTGTCPYTYVDNTPISPKTKGVLQPYFDIASQYGFANYAFQTNQGPSFQAHQFLFSGTSAPTNDQNDGSCANKGDGSPCYQWFSAELQNDVNGYWGCPAQGNNTGDILGVDPAGVEFLHVYGNGLPCYNHTTLADLLDNNTINNHAITWKYYPQGPHPGISLWTAPNAIKNICSASNDGHGNYSCGGTYWTTHVDAPPGPTPGQMAPILTDINSCKLPNVSWVIPDGSWSDHAGISDNSTEDGNYGPSWVAAIVNAVGNSGMYNCDGSQNGYWNDTVIIVVWDDWGGWYDHVLPWLCGPGSNGTCSGYPGPNEGAGLVHDFGSILNFIEWVFGTGGNFLSLPGNGNLNQGINPTYLYADYWAPDALNVCKTCQYKWSLADFFSQNWNSQPTPFTQIDAPYPASVFENWTAGDNNTATDPDDDAEESQ